MAAATFSCKADSTDLLATVLNTLLWDKDQVVLVDVSSAGLRFTVQKNKTMKAKAYLKSSCFQAFELSDPEQDLRFTLSLSVFLHCLQVFGVSSHMQMSFDQSGSAVSLILEDDGVITECEIRTLEDVDSADFNFRGSPIAARTVIKSTFLKECFSELDVPGADGISIHMMPRAPFLSMSVKGDNTSVEVDFPSDQSSEVFTEFECRTLASNTYSLSMIRPCIKALAKAENTNLRMNEDGMLSMQHVIPTRDGIFTNWVEFLLCAQEQDLD